MIEQKIGYEIDGKKFAGMLVYDDSVKEKRPAVFMEPDWEGVTPKSVGQAKIIAGKDYVVFVADVFGIDYKPASVNDLMAASRAIRDDAVLSRKRGNTAMDVFLAEAGSRGLIDPAKTAGVGYCFGAGILLDLARTGRDFQAVVVFHVTFPQSADPNGPSHLKSAVLVLHGADDPVTPRPAIHALEQELDAAKVKWQTVMYSGAVHSFADPNANSGTTRYDETLATRSYALMRNFLSDIF